VSGWILPCTLSLLTSLIGTPYLRSLEGAVLLLEDIHEAAHEIDRNLTQLLQAGLLQGIRALGFGRFTEAADSERIPSVLEEFGRALDVPVALDLEFGHGPGGACLPVGRSVTAEVMEDGTHLVWAGGHRS
jgi:muramoyltetrapeptide carboxypeptidase